MKVRPFHLKPRCPELPHVSKWIISAALLRGALRQVPVKRLSVLFYILLLTVPLAEKNAYAA